MFQIYWPPLPGQKEECFQKGKDPVVSHPISAGKVYPDGCIVMFTSPVIMPFAINLQLPSKGRLYPFLKSSYFAFE